MSDHPIQGLMDTAMSNIKAMVDVNTIVGEPVRVQDGTIIIPVSSVGFGFGAGGSEFSGKNASANQSTEKPMFGGGCGGGASIKPVAFLVVGNGSIRLLPVNGAVSPVDRIIDLVPEMVDKVNGIFKNISGKHEEKKREKKEQKEADKNPIVNVVDID
ncbi:MAG: GerW family sporulation protein [Clostridia bacterium]|nr:GerW family sporulation protein [Clostridia bacterium]